MNKQKLATIGCILLVIACSLSFGFCVCSRVLLPLQCEVCERALYYPEALYGEYQKEAERTIAEGDYTSQYHSETTIYSENSRTTWVIKIGDYDSKYAYPNYITATVKNFRTNEQETSFKRSRESAEEALKDAEEYKTTMNRTIGVFVVILIIFTGYLIKRVIEKRYLPAFITIIICIIVLICSVI